ncbi:MAG: glycosyltransferase family 2 protein [Opitutales bacterium]
MDVQAPAISVVISTYDDRDLVNKKLDEIKAQTAFEASEFIFVEPDSPGTERDLLEPFCAENPNCRLLALEERINLYAAWNRGWEAARAEFVCISNMDDTMHPDLLRRMTAAMQAQKWDLASVLITKQWLGVGWSELEGRRTRDLTLSTRPGPFFAWRSDLKDTVGMFDERMTVAGDRDFWARAGHFSLKTGLLPEILYIYSKHPGQLSKTSGFEAVKAADMKIAGEKPYAHQWPPGIQRAIRRQRRFHYCFGWKRVLGMSL